MTARQMEEWLGLEASSEGRRLLGIALRREEESGKRFMIRTGSEKLTRYWFTGELVRKHLPELWEGRFERTSRRVGQMLERIKTHIDDHIEDRIENSPKIAELESRVDDTLDMVMGLATQMNRGLELAETRRNSHTDSNRGQDRPPEKGERASMGG